MKIFLKLATTAGLAALAACGSNDANNIDANIIDLNATSDLNAGGSDLNGTADLNSGTDLNAAGAGAGATGTTNANGNSTDTGNTAGGNTTNTL